jgi:Ca2+-binding RTX toxin-like protein
VTTRVIDGSNSIVNTTDNTQALSLGLEDFLYVKADGHIIATGSSSNGLFVGASSDDVIAIVDGLIHGETFGIYSFGDDCRYDINGRVTSTSNSAISISGVSTDVVVGREGYISGDSGVTLGGSFHRLVNHGLIQPSDSGAGVGVRLAGVSNVVTNYGTIYGGVVLQGENMAVDNHGIIDGSMYLQFGDEGLDVSVSNTGVWNGSVGLTEAVDDLDNSGTINGAVNARDGDDTVVNTGRVDGGVFLGAGGDTYDGRRGEVTVAILGDVGGDTMRGGRLEDWMWGQDDRDQLTGGNGDDTLDGGGQGDTLTGGRGDDLLIGGGGSDRFVFNPGFGHDVVTDFDATGAGADVIRFSTALFGSFNQVGNRMSQVGDDVVIKVSADQTIVLQDVTLADLDAGDFQFVS